MFKSIAIVNPRMGVMAMRPISSSAVVMKKAKKAPRKHKQLGIKGPMNAYTIFFSERRVTLPDSLSFGEKGRELGAIWRSLSDAEKAVYQKKSEEDRARFEREMKALENEA